MTNLDNSPAAGLLHRLKTCYPLLLALFSLEAKELKHVDARILASPHGSVQACARNAVPDSAKLFSFRAKSVQTAPESQGAGHQNNIHVGECGGVVGFLPKNGYRPTTKPFQTCKAALQNSTQNHLSRSLLRRSPSSVVHRPSSIVYRLSSYLCYNPLTV
jgi:hypothetical protein